MSRVVSKTGSFSGYPTSYDSVDKSYYSLNSAAKGYTDSSSTTYAQMNWARGSGAESWVYFKFDTSSIPEDATISSVTCYIKAYVSTANSKNVTTREVALCSGTTVLGSPSTLTTSVATYTITVTSLTREQASDLRIKLHAIRGTSNTTSNYSIRFYGATLNIEYSYNETYYTVTASSNVSGISVSPESEEYLKGSDATVTISGSGRYSVIDNSEDVTGQVESGVLTISNIQTDHVIEVNEAAGQSIYYKVNGTWVPASKIWIKQSGTWKESTVFIKDSGTWKS